MRDENQIKGILTNLKEIQHEIKNQMHSYFKELSLTGPQGMVVLMVNKHKSLKISEISHKIGLSNSTVSGIIDRLEQQDCVKRVRSDKDRRVVNVTLTDNMKAKLLTHDKVLDGFMTLALDHGTDKELEEIAQGLSILNKLLNKTKKENSRHV